MTPRLFLAALVLAASNAVSNAAIPLSGLIAQYTFEGNANDQSGNNNGATPQGTFGYVAGGMSGSAIRLNGDNSLFYSGGGHVNLPLFTSGLNAAFTISLWAKGETNGGQAEYVSFGILDSARTGIGIGFSGTRPSIYWYIDSGAGGANHTDAVTITKDFGTLSEVSNSWKNLTMTYDAGLFSAYLDGILIGQGNVNFAGFPMPVANLGRHYWSNGSAARMSVTMDDVLIYNRALTATEVRRVAGLPDIVPPTPSRLINISSRAYVGTGDAVQIAGFVLHGDTPKSVLIRSVGPSLAALGVPSPLSLPQIDLYRMADNSLVAHNEGWGGTGALSAAFLQVGAFGLPTNSKDAGMLVTLNPGAYTAITSGKNGTTGINLLEVYEMP